MPIGPSYMNGNIGAACPGCAGAVTTYERTYRGQELGAVIKEGSFHLWMSGSERYFKRIVYRLFRCAGCGRGGFGAIYDDGGEFDGILKDFYPICIEQVPLPKTVPKDIEAEFREAERDIAFLAWRSASGMLRSTLEKTLKANGYTQGSLKDEIDEAVRDGILTEARAQRAHDDIRVLGNDVLHDEWRPVEEAEVQAAHHYTQRILEDFYDDRNTVEAKLKAKGRLKLAAPKA